MQSRDFAFWLQGYFELGGGAEGLTKDQVELVKTHLSLVFRHDPAMEHDKPATPTPKDPFYNPKPPVLIEKVYRDGVDQSPFHETRVFC